MNRSANEHEFFGRLRRSDWDTYAIILRVLGRDVAEEFRQTRAKENQKVLRSQSESEPWAAFFASDCEYASYEKKFLPYWMDDAAWAEEEEADTIHAPWSPYDCTGAVFTAWVSRFEVPDGTWVYRYLTLDI